MTIIAASHNNTKRVEQSITSWIPNYLKLCKSGIQGLGIFATENIKKGTVVSVFGGKIYTKDQIIHMRNGTHIKDTASQLDNSFYIGPLSEKDREWAAYFNHSCSPNCKIWRSVFLVSIRTIRAEEELTFDYAHSHNKLLNFKCSCKSKKCRQYIRNKDYLNPEFQKKNRMYFAEWMRDALSLENKSQKI